MTAPSETPGDRRPLDGIVVVELSHMVMGPTCGLILGDLGAEVIKIEPAPDGDNTRRLPGSGAGFFAAFNRNKRSLAVDLKAPAGRDLARRLIARADVVAENFRDGALDGLGLGWAALRAAHPRLICCSLKGFLAGPYAHRTALDEVVQMMGGLAYMTGPSGRPLRAGASVNDIMGGMFAAIAILAALRERDRTGMGQIVRAGLFETNVLLVAQHMLQFAVTGQPAAPMPERISAWGVYDVFDAADGRQIFVAVVSDTQWRAFCAAFALPELAADTSLATNPERVAARARLIPALRARLATLDQAEIARICEGAGLPFAPIARPHELYDDPHLNAPGALVDVTLGDGRPARAPALPIEMDGRRFDARRDVPRIGADSRALAAWAGLSEAEIAAMEADGTLRAG